MEWIWTALKLFSPEAKDSNPTKEEKQLLRSLEATDGKAASGRNQGHTW